MKKSIAIVIAIVLIGQSGCAELASHSNANPIWLNGVTGKPLKHISPYRVEQPASIKLQVAMPANTQVVAFYDGEQLLGADDQAPFELADIQKLSQQKRLGTGVGLKPATRVTLSITAVGYSAKTQTNISEYTGGVTARKTIPFTIDYSGVTAEKIFAPQQTLDWVNTHLDEVLVKKTFAATNGRILPYRLFVPPAYNPKVNYPLVVFLHGRGQRGTDNSSKMFNNVGLFSGPQSIVAPNSQQDFPAFVLVPQCSNISADEEWAHWDGNSPSAPFAGLGLDGSYQQASLPSASAAAALELIDDIANRYKIDKQRIYLTGISMGGFGTWEFTTRRPHLFAAAVPMAGYSDYRQVKKIAHIPFWIFHGDRDEYNPVAGSRTMARLLREKAQADVVYTEFSGLKHNETFAEAWRNPNILPWLFAH